MAEWAMMDAIDSGYSAAYIAPLKAIVEEKAGEWKRKYPEYKVGLYTGDAVRAAKAPVNENILLFTPEKLNVYLQGWKKHISWISRLGVLVVDEFHFLGDRSRGACLEALITRLCRVNPFVRIVGFSATLSNIDELADWLKARVFISEWRPIPLQRKIVRFKKATEKLELLQCEVEKTTAEGGKVLVFVNSRKRAESVARHLIELRFRANFHHAGLSGERRTSRQDLMRRGEIDVLVATSTLEMGVNFPARKVVVYDAYAFDGETFSPLSVQRYLQFSGRAGRAGLDETGESVLFLPVWSNGNIDYLNDAPAPVRSGLFSRNVLLKEILYEVSGRLAISERHLEVNFADRTLWRTQGGMLDLKKHVTALITAGLVKRSGEEEEYLSVTALGRVACQMGVTPGTLMLLANLFREYLTVTSFDLLFACCLSEETTPHLGFNFEEIDLIADTILHVPSHLLDRPVENLSSVEDKLTPKRILSAIKCATILYQYCHGKTIEDLAAAFDTYQLDIEILKDNASWVLETAQRVFAILYQQQVMPDEKEETATSHHEKVCLDLSRMLHYGIPYEALGLVEIGGIGPRRAQALVRHGILNVKDLLDEDEEALVHALKMKIPKIREIIASTEEVLERDKYQVNPFERDRFVWMEMHGEVPHKKPWTFDLDPYRLRRALELTVEHCSAEKVRVSGGAEPHVVLVETDPRKRRVYSCDCQDFVKGNPQCKHIIRARLELRDDVEIIGALKALRENGQRPVRYALGDLWLKAGKAFDLFYDRSVDYGGDQFLKRLQTRGEWKR